MRLYILLTLMGLVSLGGWTAQGVETEVSSGRERVLALVSYHMTHIWTKGVVTAMKEALPEVDFKVVELDSIRVPDEMAWRQEWERQLPGVKDGRVRAVVALDNVAADLVAESGGRGELPKGFPVVVAGYSGDTARLREKWGDLTGLEQGLNVEGNVRVGLKLFPEVEKVIAVMDSSAESMHYRQLLEGVKTNFPGVKFMSLNERDTGGITAMLKRIQAEATNTIVLQAPWRALFGNDYQTANAFGVDLGRACTKPYLVHVDQLLGMGALGGYVTRSETHGREAAALLERVLAGEKAGEIPFVKGTEEPVFDWQLAKASKLNMKAFPAGTIWVNKPPTFWEVHGMWLGGIVLVFTVLGLGTWNLTEYQRRQKRRNLQIFAGLPVRVVVVARDERVLFLNMPASEQEAMPPPKTLREFRRIHHDVFAGAVREVFETGRPKMLEYTFEETCRTVTMSKLDRGVFEEDAVVWLSYDNTELQEARRRAEALARESQEHLNELREEKGFRDAVLNALPLMFFVKDAENDYRYLMCNPGVEKFLGKSEEEITGKTDAELFGNAEETVAFNTNNDELKRTGGTLETMAELTDAEGNTRHMRTFLRYYRGKKGRLLLLGASVDVTDLQNARHEAEQAEADLREHTALWNAVMEALPVQVYAKDVKDDFRYVMCNQALETAWGQSRTEIIGSTDFDLHPNEREITQRFRDGDVAASHGETWAENIIDRINGPDGELKYMHVRRKLFRSESGDKLLIGVALDVTESELAREQLETMNAEIADLLAQQTVMLDTLPVYVFTKDIHNEFRYTSCNQVCVDLFGKKSSEEVIGQRDADLFPNDEEVAHVQEEDRRAMENAGEFASEILPFTGADGKRRIGHFRRKKLALSGGREWLFGVVEDLTDAVEAREAEGEATEKQLRTLSNLEMACEVTRTVWCRVELDTRRIIECSRFFSKIWLVEDGIAASIEDTVVPEDATKTRQAYVAALAEGGGRALEFRVQLDGQELRYCHALAKPEPEQNGHPVLFFVIQDVSESVRMAGGLKEQQELWNLVINAIPAQLSVRDLDAESRYVTVNRAFAEFFGSSAEMFAGRKAEDVVPDRMKEQYTLLRKPKDDVKDIEIGVARDEEWPGADGKQHILRILRLPFTGADGRRLMLSVANDVTQAVEAKRAAENSARWFRLTLDSIGDGVMATDAEGNVITMNPVAERMMGVKEEEAVGHVHEDYFRIVSALDDMPMASPLKRTLRTGTIVELANHTDLLSRTGQRYHIADSSAPIKDSSGKIVGAILVFRDVTEEYEQRDQLRRALLSLEHASELTRSAAFEIDIDTCVVSGSRLLRTLWDVKEDRAVPAEDWVHPEDYPAYHAAWVNMVHGRAEYVNVGYRAFTPDGSVHHYRMLASMSNSAPNARHAVGVVQDVTDIVQSAGRLKESQGLWDLIINTLPFMFFAKDPANDFRYTLSNRAFAEFTGHTVEDILGKTDAEIFHRPADVDWFRQQDQNALEHSGPLEVMEYPVDGAGVQRTLRTTKMSFQRSDGTTLLLGATVDLTEMTRLAEEKAVLQEQLQQAEKLESIGRVSGQIAHDFNNMLQAIMGSAEMAMETLGATGSPAIHDVEAIQDIAKRSSALTKSLLTFARKQSTQPKKLDLNEVIETALPLLQQLAGKSVEIRAVTAQETVPVLLDASQMDQLLTNLCVNARDAMSDTSGSTLTFSTTRLTLDVPFQTQTGFLPPGVYSRLAVTDTGMGMDDSTIKRIFEPFFTTKGEGKGTGLGLATVYGIMKQAKGGIHVLSRPDRGTTFHLYFPAPDANTSNTADLDVSADSPPMRGSILLVDDEEMVLHSTGRMLESLGFEVHITQESVQALEWVRDENIHLDLLISDVIMPVMTGPDLVKKVLEIRPDLPYMFISAYPSDLLRTPDKNQSMESFLSKPFTFAALTKRVEQFFPDSKKKSSKT